MYISIISFAVAFGTIFSNVKDFPRGWAACNRDDQEKHTQILKHISNARHVLFFGGR